MTQQDTTYHSLEEIRAKKESLRDSIREDDRQIQALWHSLFQKPDMLTAATPSKRLSSLFSTGAGIFDGLLLGWKLYRKFSGKPTSTFSLFSKRRR